MKLLLAITMALILTSCGAIDTLSKNCGNGAGCKFLFGKIDRDQQEQIDANRNDIDKIKLQIAALQSKVSNLELSDVNINLQLLNLNNNVEDLQDTDANLQAQIDALSATLSTTVNNVLALQDGQQDLQDQVDALGNVDQNLQDQIDDLNGRLTSLENSDFQDQINDILVELASLSSLVDGAITEILDPCNDSPGYDEVLLKTTSGKVVAYFEDGNGQGNQRRHLTVLIPHTPYGTTDNTGCTFRVDEDGELY